MKRVRLTCNDGYMQMHHADNDVERNYAGFIHVLLSLYLWALYARFCTATHMHTQNTHRRHETLTDFFENSALRIINELALFPTTHALCAYTKWMISTELYKTETREKETS